MAQDSGTDSKTNQDVDLDELEVVILIIGKNASVLNQSATFLTRRGWPTSVITNVSKAIEHIAEKKPDFVLLSFNHPNPAVLKLPDLITQTFNLTSVGFVEQLDSASQQRLNNFKIRHKIQGSPSGPNLQRSIRKILAEKFNVKTEASGADAKDREASGGNVTVKGTGAAEKDGTVIQSGGKGLGPDGNVRIKSDEVEAAAVGNVATGGRARPGNPEARTTVDDGEDGVETEAVSNGKYTLSKKTRKSLKELAAKTEGDSDAKSTGSANELLGKLKKDLFGEAGVDPNAEADVPTDAGAGAAGAAGESLAARAEAARRAAQQSAMDAQAAAISAATNAYYANAKNNHETAPLTPDELKAVTEAVRQHAPDTGPRARYLTAAELAALTPGQLFERATFLALTQVAQPSTQVYEVGSLAKVAVFPVDSRTTPGYLVLGMQPDPHRIEDFFLRNCEAALREHMTALGVTATVEGGFWVHIPEVNFKSWVAREAGFHIVLPHDESEVVLGFLPFAQPSVKTEAHGENSEMLKVSLDEISTESPVNFKAYLHLKKNQKYFLYLRDGRQLQPEQKERLKGRKVNDIFMASADVDNLRAFRAGTFLRDRIKKSG